MRQEGHQKPQPSHGQAPARMAEAVRTAMRERTEPRTGVRAGQPPERDTPKLSVARRQRPRAARPAWAPAPGEILIRMQACDLSPVDSALDTGATSQLLANGPRNICGMDAAGTVMAIGDDVTRFAIGDDVFGHLPAQSWAWIEGPCGRTTADGPHIEHRPDGLGPLAAAAVAHSGLTAKTILREAELRAGQTALVIGETSGTGRILLSLLDEAGAHVIDRATVQYTTGDPTFDALTTYPDLDLLVDLVSFGEPYFITATAREGAIVSAQPRPDGPGVRRIGISAAPGDLAALAERALDEHHRIDVDHVHALEGWATAA